MTSREIKLTKRVALDYILVGMAITNPETIRSCIQTNELLTRTGQAMYAAAIEGDRQAFRDVLSVRLGFTVEESETIGEGLVRIIKESNVDQAAWSVADAMAEQLASCDELADTVEILERATTALRNSLKEREQCHVPS